MNGWFKSWYFDQIIFDYITIITFILYGHVMIWSKPFMWAWCDLNDY
jgi:hypothetical protein